LAKLSPYKKNSPQVFNAHIGKEQSHLQMLAQHTSKSYIVSPSNPTILPTDQHTLKSHAVSPSSPAFILLKQHQAATSPETTF